MLKKYIIELEENEHLYKTEMVLGEPVLCGVFPEPYNEPDLEQVRKEAYQKGLKDGVAKCLNREHCTKEAYQRGLDEAWKAARKIANMPYGEEEKVFGSGGWTFITKHTAAEAIEKLKQYEQEQEGFHVGDEFENETGKKFVVLKVNGKEIDRYIDEEGKTYCMNVKYKVMRKTGRHFPEITTFFEKMRKGQE